MELVIKKDGSFTITGKIQTGVKSGSGKNFVLATTNGFIGGTDENGNDVKFGVNIIAKEYEIKKGGKK